MTAGLPERLQSSQFLTTFYLLLTQKNVSGGILPPELRKSSGGDMRSRRRKFWSHDNRFRVMLTLGLAVLLPAVALIYVNFHHLESIQRDKKVEALIHRDFQY